MLVKQLSIKLQAACRPAFCVSAAVPWHFKSAALKQHLLLYEKFRVALLCGRSV